MPFSVGVRTFSALIAASFVLAACGGGAHSVPSGLVPGGSAGGSSGGGSSAAHGNGNVAFTIKIPRTMTSSRLRTPATISAGTNSLAVTVNGATPAQTFNIAAPACNTSASPIVCTFNVGAPYGLDSFLIETFSGSNGTGTALNAAATTLNVTQAGPNQASATAGAIVAVNDAQDGAKGAFSCAPGSSTCTLRQAIFEADHPNTSDPTYTTAIMFAPGISSITLTSPIGITSSNQAETTNIVILGPGASAPPNPLGAGAPAAASSLTISGGNAVQLFTIDSGTNVTIVGLTLTQGNTSSDQGAAIDNEGNLAIFNSVFSANTTPNEGGAIANGAVSNATLTVMSSSFVSNGAGNATSLSNGGAIINFTTLAISASAFTSNTSSDSGGAVYDEGDGTTTITGSTFTGNSSGYGGAVVADEGMAIVGCTFNGNTAFDGFSYGEGGAIYNDNGPLTVDKSTFTNNVAGSMTVSGGEGTEGKGGAISIDDPSQTVTITNSTFGTSTLSGNFAGGPGPFDYGFGGAIYMTNDSSPSPGLTLSGNAFTGNTAKGGTDAFGGAIDDELGQVCSGTLDCTTPAVADTFTNNTADGTANTSPSGSSTYGGAAYLDDGSGSGNPTVWIGATFNGNQALGAGGSSWAFGGGILDDCSDFIGSQLTFTNNRAAGAGEFSDGGGLYVTSFTSGCTSPTTTLSNALFTGNFATGASESGGGGLESDYADVSLTNVTFTSNTASAVPNPTVSSPPQAFGGGFAYFKSNSGALSKARRPGVSVAREMTDSSRRARVLARRQADKARRAAAIAARHSAARSRRLAARGRAAAGYRRPKVVLTANTISNVTFTGNTADGGSGGTAYGGGADLSGTITVTGANFSNNTATASGNGPSGFGGGLSYSSTFCGTLTFTGSLTNNSALTDGGGFWNSCSATLTNTTITSNTASSGNGGGIWNGGGLTTDSSDTISGNSPTPDIFNALK